MKRYLVKCVDTATEENPNFAGNVLVSLYGKNQELIAMMGSQAEQLHTVKELDEEDIREFGYSRACDARRSYMYNFLEDGRFWFSERKIIEFEV